MLDVILHRQIKLIIQKQNNMKTKLHYLLLPFALAFLAPKTNAQVSTNPSTLIQFWDFNSVRSPIAGGTLAGGGGDSLGTAYSYANFAATSGGLDSNNATWPLTANYVAVGLTAGHIVYHRPTALYSAIGMEVVGERTRDSILDGTGPGGASIYDYSSNKYTYFTKSDSGYAEGNAYLKARNPSDSCEMYLYIPTTGYTNIQLQFAISASSSKGALYNIFSYSTNGGTTWKNLTTAMDTFNIGGVRRPDTLQVINPTTVASKWYPVQINFTTDASVNNNANFILRLMLAGISSRGGTTGSGNDRYDNFAVWGTSTALGVNEVNAKAAGYSIYPNPSTNAVNIISDNYTGTKVITMYNLVGQIISTTENYNKQTTLDISSLNSGVYFVEITELATGNKYTEKIVKE